jgi:hypothetical protein
MEGAGGRGGFFGGPVQLWCKGLAAARASVQIP